MPSKSSWDGMIQEWAAQQADPFSIRAVIAAVGPGGELSRHVAQKALKRLGYAPDHPRGNGVKGEVLWRRVAAPEPSSHATEILQAREALDAAAATLTLALQQWEANLAARQDPPPPPPPVDTEAVFRAGRQEGRQARETEILALIDERLGALAKGGLAYVSLWHLANTIRGRLDQ